jgi:hypothetical protein
MIYYVGDLHGRVEEMINIDRDAMKHNVKYVIQVGDFGIRWPGGPCSMYKYFHKRQRKNPAAPIWITCGGNHENWSKWLKLSEKQNHPDLVELAPGCFYAKRGTIQTLDGIKHLFIGGAESIDKHLRKEGVDWWPYETPSYQEFSLAFSNLEKEEPEVVVSHDCPTTVPVMKIKRDKNPTPQNLQNMFTLSNHQPKRWYFGHHHTLQSWEMNKTTFYCCGFHGNFYSYPLK